ncbi:MAG TPA: helix-turn-helix domain-containing protein [Chloroflexota bacterium]|nr:helix-turn-helix domain-containing protein [Chloroflexota bacterium]
MLHGQFVPRGSPRLVSTRQVRAGLGVSQERLARACHVSARTVERWEKNEELPSSREKLRCLDTLNQIGDLGEAVFGREAFLRFMKLPQPIFQGLTPWEVIERGEADQVLRVLAAEHEGLGF